jgi:hypothetical protein
VVAFEHDPVVGDHDDRGIDGVGRLAGDVADVQELAMEIRTGVLQTTEREQVGDQSVSSVALSCARPS